MTEAPRLMEQDEAEIDQLMQPSQPLTARMRAATKNRRQTTTTTARQRQRQKKATISIQLKSRLLREKRLGTRLPG